MIEHSLRFTKSIPGFTLARIDFDPEERIRLAITWSDGDGRPVLRARISRQAVNIDTAGYDIAVGQAGDAPALETVLRYRLRFAPQIPASVIVRAARTRPEDAADMLLGELNCAISPSPLTTVRGTPDEFLALARAISALTGLSIRIHSFLDPQAVLAVPAISCHVMPAGTYRPAPDALEHVAAWHHPTADEKAIDGGRIVRCCRFLYFEEPPLSGHDRIEIRDAIAQFYDRARTDLKLTEADIVAALREIGL